MARKSIRKSNKHAYSPKNIGERVHVRQVTRIRMLEYDLPHCPSFLWFGNQWEGLFKGWLEQGAKIEVYAQKPTRESLEMLKNLRDSHNRSFIAYLFSDVKDDQLGFKKDALKSTHFTVFKTPKSFGGEETQLWVEAEHNPGQKHMYRCNYFQPMGFGVGRKEEPWETTCRKYESILNRIRDSKTRKLKKGAVTVVRG